MSHNLLSENEEVNAMVEVACLSSQDLLYSVVPPTSVFFNCMSLWLRVLFLVGGSKRDRTVQNNNARGARGNQKRVEGLPQHGEELDLWAGGGSPPTWGGAGLTVCLQVTEDIPGQHSLVTTHQDIE